MRPVIQRLAPVPLLFDLHGTPTTARGARHGVPSRVASEARTQNVGEGQGGKDCRTSDVVAPPTPSPSSPGGGESAWCLYPAHLRGLPLLARDDAGSRHPSASPGGLA